MNQNINNIKILDCTLRDGGMCLEDLSAYGLNKEFSDGDKDKIAKKLYDANIDFIELGALEENICLGAKYAMYENIEQISRIIPSGLDVSKYVVLFRGPDILNEKIPFWRPDLIKKVRLIIRYSELEKSIDYCKMLSEKGYDVFIQPMVTMRYSESELDYLISSANEMNAFALYFVDSYGYMNIQDVEKLFLKYHEKLHKKIYIGFHAHNNLNLAFANSLHFINLAQINNRKIFIDSTCMGMGQGAGNLQTELITPYLNRVYEKKYDIGLIFDVCEIVETLSEQALWGYSPLCAIPAINHVAYKFAIALRKKYNLSYKQIYGILENMPDEFVHRFSNENLQKLLQINGKWL